MYFYADFFPTIIAVVNAFLFHLEEVWAAYAWLIGESNDWRISNHLILGLYVNDKLIYLELFLEVKPNLTEKVFENIILSKI